MILEALTCMALNIYWESRSESTAGKLAVGHVVINRVNSDRYPDDVCSVVKEAIVYSGTNKPVLNQCQFSWYCDNKPETVRDPRAWGSAMTVAVTLMEGSHDITDGAINYHALDVLPNWADSRKVTARIDNHIFYKDIK